MKTEKKYMLEAIKLSAENIKKEFGGPFGAVIVKDGKIIGKGFNHVLKNNDPTCHAEVMAIRDACQNIKNFDLENCEIYTSCEPCPMCYGAIHRARIGKIYYANTEKDAADIGFDDKAFNDDMKKDIHQRQIPIEQICHTEAKKVFDDRKKTCGDNLY